MTRLPPGKKRNLPFLKKRRATCGACGCDDVVDTHMRTDRVMQWKPRPEQETDEYYCGCQSDFDDRFSGSWWDPGF